MLVKLGNLLGKQKERFKGEIDNAQLFEDFNDTIKNIHPKAAEFVNYKDIHNNTLYLKVDDSIWIGELALYKEDIRKTLNRKRSKPIKDIKFTLS